MTTITIRLSEEQKKAIQGYSKLNNQSVSQTVLEAILNVIEDEEDYQLALEASNAPISTLSIRELAKESGIDYDEL